MTPNTYHLHRIVERQVPKQAKNLLKGVLRTTVDELITARAGEPQSYERIACNFMNAYRFYLRQGHVQAMAVQLCARHQGPATTSNLKKMSERITRKLKKKREGA